MKTHVHLPKKCQCCFDSSRFSLSVCVCLGKVFPIYCLSGCGAISSIFVRLDKELGFGPTRSLLPGGLQSTGSRNLFFCSEDSGKESIYIYSLGMVTSIAGKSRDMDLLTSTTCCLDYRPPVAKEQHLISSRRFTIFGVKRQSSGML